PLHGVFSTPRIGGARHSTAECSREYPIRDVHVWVAETRGVLAREIPGAGEHKTTICTSMETGGEQNAVFVHAYGLPCRTVGHLHTASGSSPCVPLFRSALRPSSLAPREADAWLREVSAASLPSSQVTTA